jgi:hypothetical protein
MKSPEKFASNILSNRLELLINFGLLKVTKLPNDKKTKLYYLTDKGIDLYPIVYEMMYWSKRNLNQKFKSFGVQFFKESKNVIASEFIKSTQSDYINSRNSFLSI